MEPNVSAAKHRRLWWGAYILLLLSMIASTWAFANF